MRIVITGGAGFIGCNSAHRFLSQGHDVVMYDNLSRRGARSNIDWLHQQHGENVRLVQADIRDFEALSSAIRGAEVVIHLASQVAVTYSVENPREDFEINALGTFNVLEAVRHNCPEAVVLYASTNKVYGAMEDAKVIVEDDRYGYEEFTHGIPESFPLDFHSPYGCSKGTGDQYMRDYARIYDLKTVVFRQSCIYGPRQFGVEDQGWVAHFIIAAVLGRPIWIFGDGRQVRDLLHVDDLVRAYELSITRIDELRGDVLNLGGGPQNAFSVWTEFGPLLESLANHPVPVTYSAWRPGDQRVFVADIRKAEAQLGWKPSISPEKGIRELYRWVNENQDLFAKVD